MEQENNNVNDEYQYGIPRTKDNPPPLDSSTHSFSRKTPQSDPSTSSTTFANMQNIDQLHSQSITPPEQKILKTTEYTPAQNSIATNIRPALTINTILTNPPINSIISRTSSRPPLSKTLKYSLTSTNTHNTLQPLYPSLRTTHTIHQT